MHALLLALLPVVGFTPIRSGSPDDVIRLGSGATPVLEYRRGGVPFKPYVVQLRSPGGVNVLRDQVADHLHHHGLMFAVKAADVNFWEEVAGCGPQVSTGARSSRSSVEDTLVWRAPDAGPIMHEKRRLTLLHSPDRGATLLQWRTRLAAPKGSAAPVSLTGAHYHGLGMRFVQPMDGGAFETSDGDRGSVFRGEERLMSGRWCAYRASVEGREVTVAMFDHPANPRPVTWFTMPRPFGYLSATLRLHESPLAVLPGRPVTLTYGVAVFDGQASAERIEAVCRAWLRATRTGGR